MINTLLAKSYNEENPKFLELYFIFLKFRWAHPNSCVPGWIHYYDTNIQKI